MSRIEDALENAMRQSASPLQEQSLDRADKKTEASQIASPLAPVQLLQPTDPCVIGFNNATEHIAEEYRKLRSMILQATKKSGEQNTIIVTSPDSGEGKTITAINLALILAQELNHTALLVDADLRRPMIASYLGLKPEIGLSDCLMEDIDLGGALIKTDVPTLSVLSAGRKVTNPVELLSSNKMKDIMREIKCRYRDRYVIIDTPPVLPFAETHVISSYVDGILMVVKEGETSTANLRVALDILKDGVLLGFVYNNAEPSEIQKRYYSRYPAY